MKNSVGKNLALGVHIEEKGSYEAVLVVVANFELINQLGALIVGQQVSSFQLVLLAC